MKVWKTFANYIASTDSRKVTGALPQRWAKVMEMLPTSRNIAQMLSNSFENVPTWCCLNVILESCKNIVTTLRESSENVGTWSCCNIIQESFKSVATMLPQNVAWKHLHNIMATFIDNVEVLWYSQCCNSLSEIWENQRRKHQDMLYKKTWRSKKRCPHHFTGWFYVPLPLSKCP